MEYNSIDLKFCDDNNATMFFWDRKKQDCYKIINATTRSPVVKKFPHLKEYQTSTVNYPEYIQQSIMVPIVEPLDTWLLNRNASKADYMMGEMKRKRKKDLLKDCVYLIRNPFNKLIKIGMTYDINKRYANLCSQSGCSFELLFYVNIYRFERWGMPCSHNSRHYEKELHTYYTPKRQKINGCITEWFKLCDSEIADIYDLFNTIKDKKYFLIDICKHLPKFI